MFRRKRSRLLRCLVVLVALLGTSLLTPPPVGANTAGEWPMDGQNIFDTRSNPFETTISSRNVSQLAVRWASASHGDVSATPAVVDGAVYFPDWGGYLNKLDAATGRLIWSRRISDYDGIAGAIARTSPAVSNGLVYIGDQNGAHLIAIDANTGVLVWIRQLDDHPAAILTAAPLVFDGVVYEGVSSDEEVLAESPSYPCCTFRGSVTATDARTGRLLWQRYTIPDNGGVPGGYSGGAVWSSTPALDPVRGALYVTTGNNYSVPSSVTDCQNRGSAPDQCFSPDNHIDSIVALDARTGAIDWTAGAADFDTWNGACIIGKPPNNCPEDSGVDSDFGDGAHLFTVPAADGGWREVVGAGQKSGAYWLLDAVTGQVLWSSAPGPGSYRGGILWGTAMDGDRIYLAEADGLGQPYQLPDGSTTTHSSFVALDPVTGRVLWQVVDPSDGHAAGPVTAVNGVVYAGSTSGHMYALDGETGKILFDYLAPYSSEAGPAVVNGTVFWGNGYAKVGTGSTTSGTFYAFAPRTG